MSGRAVVIVGGGIAGATVLHRLCSAGIDAVLLERGSALGGAIGTVRTDRGALVERGPNSVQRSSPRLLELIADLGLDHAVVTAGDAARNRYILRGGRLIAAPGRPKDLFSTRLFTRRAKLRLLRERFVKPAPAAAEESLAAFVERRIGREFLDYAVDPFVAGIYAGSPERLSVRHAFPKLYELEQKHGSLIRGASRLARARKKEGGHESGGGAGGPSRMFSFESGMAALPMAIQNRWGDRIVTGARVDAIARVGGMWRVEYGRERVEAARLVMAADAGAASQLLADMDHEVADALRQIEYSPVAVVAALYDRGAIEHPLDGFGLLIPALERRRILGAIFSSTIFPNRAPEGTALVTAFVGGARGPALALVGQDELEFETHAELRRLLGIGARPIETISTVWPRAIPQYTLGYGEVLAALDRAEERIPGLHLVGNYRGGISVGDCVASAWEAAERIRALHGVAQFHETAIGG